MKTITLFCGALISVLLLLQGVAEFLRSLHAAMTGVWLRAPSLTPERMMADV